jgi:hypothetical protein
MYTANTTPSPTITIVLPELNSNLSPAFAVCTVGFELVVSDPIAVVDPMADIP